MNVKKYVLAALMMVAMAFALCSCGSGVDGTYVISEYNGQSVDQTIEQMKELGMDYTAETFCSIKLDGKNVTLSFMGVSVNGTYEVNGETLTMTMTNGDKSESATATIKDGTITWTKDSETMVLKKK